MNYYGKISKFRYFQAVCKYGGVTKAANELAISQPSITTAIKELEKELGVPLFHREKNALVITAAGEEVLNKTDEMLMRFDKYYNELLDIGTSQGKQIRIGAPPVMGTVWIPAIYGQIKECFPDLELTITECVASTAYELLDSGLIDIALVTDVESRAKYEQIEMGNGEFCLCVNREHPLAEKKEITCKEIGDAPLALLTTGSTHQTVVMDMFQREGVEPNIIFSIGEQITMYSLIKDHNIATISYRDIFSEHDDLVCIPMQPPRTVTYAICWHKANYISETTRKVIKIIAKTIQKENRA